MRGDPNRAKCVRERCIGNSATANYDRKLIGYDHDQVVVLWYVQAERWPGRMIAIDHGCPECIVMYH